MVKNASASEAATGDVDSVSGSGRSPEKEMATHSSVLAGIIPRAEEPGGYSPRVAKNLPRLSDCACARVVVSGTFRKFFSSCYKSSTLSGYI